MMNYLSKLLEKFPRIPTSANWPVVTPGSQCICHSLTSDALRTLQHIVIFTGKLHTCTHPMRKMGGKRKELQYILNNKHTQNKYITAFPGPNKEIRMGNFTSSLLPT